MKYQYVCRFTLIDIAASFPCLFLSNLKLFAKHRKCFRRFAIMTEDFSRFNLGFEFLYVGNAENNDYPT